MADTDVKVQKGGLLCKGRDTAHKVHEAGVPTTRPQKTDGVQLEDQRGYPKPPASLPLC